MFGLAHPIDGGLAVRRRVPLISFRHLRRMPESVRAAHENWLHASIGVTDAVAAEAADNAARLGRDLRPAG